MGIYRCKVGSKIQFCEGRFPCRSNAAITRGSSTLVPASHETQTISLYMLQRRYRKSIGLGGKALSSERATSDLNVAEDSLPVSDTLLGRLWLCIFDRHLYYIPSFFMPIVTVTSALGAVFGPSILGWAASLLVQEPSLIAGQAVGNSTVQAVRHALFTMTQPPFSSLVRAFFSLLTVWYAFIAMPCMDWLLGNDLQNPASSKLDGATKAYNNILYGYTVLHILALVSSMHFACVSGISGWTFAGIVISCGVANGILFTVSHELIHSKKRMDRLLGNALLAVVAYMHWSKSHLIHHVKVATPEDPSSAMLGETLYHFIVRSVVGNTRDAYLAEAKRRKEKGIPFIHPQSRALWWMAIPAFLASLSWAVYGLHGLCFYVGQACVGVIMLEVVNYIEHYGLQRKKLQDGRYERTSSHHSWNATTIYTNSASFKLQRHSDHHAHEGRPYYLLKDIPDAPQLPAGYPAMMLLACIPPLFFKVMDPLVAQVASTSSSSS